MNKIIDLERYMQRIVDLKLYKLRNKLLEILLYFFKKKYYYICISSKQ